MRLLLVEDDPKLGRALLRGLRAEAHEVDLVQTGSDALGKASVYNYDVVVLDVMLPGMDGFAVCEALRNMGRHVPVLMLTARSGVSDRIRGLDAGADDYLVKPFDFGELLARLRALSRRGASEPSPLLEVGDLHIDVVTQTVSRAGQSVELTQREFAVLEFLARHAGEVVSRTQLLDHVWDEGHDGSPNVVDVYVGYLRKKLERPFGRRLIRTVRGVGFVLESA